MREAGREPVRVAGVRVHLSHGLSASGGRTIKLHGTTEANTEQRGQVRCLSLCAARPTPFPAKSVQTIGARASILVAEYAEMKNEYVYSSGIHGKK